MIEIQIGLSEPTLKTLDRLADALLAHASKNQTIKEPVQTKTEKPPKAEKKEPEKAVEPEVIKPDIDYDEMRKTIVTTIRQNLDKKGKAIKELLNTYKVPKATALADDQLQLFWADLQDLIAA